ncbi:MAG: sterol desaturase family protein [Saprospiraceae bacterium]
MIESILNSYSSYASYLWHEISHPSWHNYFYWLVLVSLFFFGLEVIMPWRKKQPILRMDFWLDAFYMFFNFFLFSLIIYNAASDLIVNLFNNGISLLTGGFDLQAANPMRDWPMWAILLTGFVLRDFIQWWVHRLLHKVSWLWKFHMVHHSVKQMGFAAHLRYHWMETIVYRTIEYIPLALLGIGLYDFFILHIFALAWGHYNHANITVDKRITGSIVGLLIGISIAFGLADISLAIGLTILQQVMIVGVSGLLGAFILGPVMKYIFNSPEMHIWHHVHNLPEDRQFGINFGLTLAIWDYLFGQAYIPKEGRDITLGFPGVEDFPDTFKKQATYGF